MLVVTENQTIGDTEVMVTKPKGNILLTYLVVPCANILSGKSAGASD